MLIYFPRKINDFRAAGASPRLFKPIRWYLQQLRWSLEGDDANRSTSVAELTLDFYAATKCPLTAPGQEEPGTIKEQCHVFSTAARGVANAASAISAASSAPFHSPRPALEIGMTFTRSARAMSNTWSACTSR